MSIDAFTRRSAITVTAELIDDSHIVHVRCSDDPRTVECTMSDFVMTIKKLKRTVGTVVLKLGNFHGGEFLNKRVAGLSNIFGFVVVVEPADETV